MKNETGIGERLSYCEPIMQWSRDYITRGVRLQKRGSHDAEPDYDDRLATHHRLHLCNPEIQFIVSITY